MAALKRHSEETQREETGGGTLRQGERKTEETLQAWAGKAFYTDAILNSIFTKAFNSRLHMSGPDSVLCCKPLLSSHLHGPRVTHHQRKAPKDPELLVILTGNIFTRLHLHWGQDGVFVCVRRMWVCAHMQISRCEKIYALHQHLCFQMFPGPH